MSKLMKSWQLTALSVLLLFATACEKDDPKPNPNPNPKEISNILIETTLVNADGASGSSYIQLVAKASGSIDNANAIQIPFSSPLSVIGNDIFILPTFGKDAVHEIQKYTYKDGKLNGPEKLSVPPYSTPSNVVSVNAEKAYSPMYGLGRVLIFNPKTMKKTGEIELSPYAHTDTGCEPSYGLIRDGLYYLPLNQVDAKYMPYEDYRQVDVAIIDVKTDKVVKVISEKTSEMSFPTRPMLKDMIFTTENKDIYIACTGYFGYNPKYKQNGFVCIPAGKTEFDTSKSWDISNTNIEGTPYKPVSMFNSKYMGNGKLAAYAVIAELAEQNPYTSKNVMPVIIDLNTKSIKKIDVPISSGHGAFIDTFNNLAVFGVYGEKEVGFFTYNPQNEEVKKMLTTDGAPYFMYVFE